MRDILPDEAAASGLGHGDDPRRLPPPRLRPHRDPGGREPPPAAPERGRGEREADLQDPEARREARRAARRVRTTSPTSGSASTSRCRSPATTRTTTPSSRRRSRPSRSGRCGGPSGRSRAGTASSPSATSTSWAWRSEVAEIELILATAEALAALGLERPDRARSTTAASSAGHRPRTAGSTPGGSTSVFIALDKLDKIGRERRRGRAARRPGHAPSAPSPRCSRSWMPPRARIDRRASAISPGLVGDRAEPAVWAGLPRIIDARRDAAPGSSALEFDATLVRGHGLLHGPDLRGAATATAPRRSRAADATTG